MTTARPYLLIAGGIAATLGLLYVLGKKGMGTAAAGAGRAVVAAADGAVSGVVTGLGELVGVPRTDETECERARREGRTWDASWACPAGTFISYLVGRDDAPQVGAYDYRAQGATAADIRRIDNAFDTAGNWSNQVQQPRAPAPSYVDYSALTNTPFIGFPRP